MSEIIDHFTWTKEIQLITHEVHQIPGLANFTHYNYTASSVPTPIHAHSNMIEIHCMVKGKRYTTVEKNGQIICHTVMGNQAFLTFPFELHSNGEEPLAPCEFYAMQIDLTDPHRMLGLNEEYSLALVSQLKELDRCLSLTPQAIALLKRTLKEFSRNTPDAYRAGSMFLASFLFMLPEFESVSNQREANVDNAIKRSIDYLDSNLSEHLTLSDLALVSGYSLSRFKVKFKSEIGITPADYISWQKIDKAKELLLLKGLSVTDVAYQLGFSSSNYFSSVFKKWMNCTPLEYRRKNKTLPLS